MSEVVANTTQAAPATEAQQSNNQPNPDQKTAKANPETPAEVREKAIRKLKLQVDGEEIDAEIDVNDDEALRKELQMARAAKKRMTEAKEDKRKAFEIIKAFEQDPESMLKRLGPKGREIAEKYLLSQIQDEMLSPEEKELRELKKYKEMTEAEKAKAKADKEAEVQSKKEFEYAQTFQSTIIEALNKSGLPKSPELVKKMAGIMSKNLEFGLELTPDDLVKEVKSELTGLLKSIIGDSDGDHLISLFGDDVANKIRKSDIKKLQEKQSQLFNQGKKVDSVNQPGDIRDRRPMTMDEWRESVNRRIK